MVKQRGMTAIYAAAHFAVDFACAYFMYRALGGAEARLTALLLYNFCAFALQMPFGVLTDRFGNGRVFSAAGCALVAFAAAFEELPLMLSIVAGTGNALFHIGGGRDVLATSGGKAGRLGAFVSPGAFGLFLGAYLSGRLPSAPVIAAMCVSAAVILAACPCVKAKRAGADQLPMSRGVRIKALLVLSAAFLAVCLRSYGGFLFSFDWKTGAWSWAFVMCVVLGKTLGGFACDRFGGALTAAASLTAGAVLFLLSKNPVAGCAAVLLFNMTMPLTLRIAADALPQDAGFSFGLLTFALFLGFLPTYLGLPAPGEEWVYAAICAVTLLFIFPALRGSRKA